MDFYAKPKVVPEARNLWWTHCISAGTSYRGHVLHAPPGASKARRPKTKHRLQKSWLYEKHPPPPPVLHVDPHAQGGGASVRWAPFWATVDTEP